MFHVMAHFSLIILPVTDLLVLLHCAYQVMFLMYCLLFLCHLQPIEVPKVKRWYKHWRLVVYLPTSVELVILKRPLISQLLARIVQLPLTVHEILVKTTDVIPSWRKVQLPLPLILSLDVHRPNVLWLLSFDLNRWNIHLSQPFERYVALRIKQYCLWVYFFCLNTQMVILPWRVMQHLFCLNFHLITLVFCLCLNTKTCLCIIVLYLNLRTFVHVLFLSSTVWPDS